MLAESGLSECTHAGLCGGPSAIDVAFVLLAVLASTAWVAASMVATANVLNAPEIVARPRPLWLLVVWVTPLLGAGLWWFHQRPVLPVKHEERQ